MSLDTSASVSTAVSIGLLERADRLLAEFGAAITLLADRAFPCAELLGWLEKQPSWTYVMRLPGDTEIHGTAAPLGCQVRRLRLCRGFRNVRLWADGSHTANLLLAHPTGLAVEEPWYLISNAEPALDLVWSYGRRFCCEQLFRDQKSGCFQLEDGACGTRSGSIGSCWWSRSLCWQAVCRVMPSAWRVSGDRWIPTGNTA